MRFHSSIPSLPKAARRILFAAVAVGLGSTLGGCSSSRTAQYQPPAWVAANPPAPVPGRQVAYEPEPGDPIKEPPFEPVRRPTAIPDDPSEPFSPNYGGPRTRPPVRVSDVDVDSQDPEPARRPAKRQASDASRAYFRRAAPAATTAAAD
jgi:hypothetical protein